MTIKQNANKINIYSQLTLDQKIGYAKIGF